MSYPLFISCPRNLEYLLEDELKALGLNVTQVSPLGIYGDSDLKTLYNICLWSRLANRVQLILFTGPVNNPSSLTQLCAQHPWQELLDASQTFAVEFHGQCPFYQ